MKKKMLSAAVVFLQFSSRQCLTEDSTYADKRILLPESLQIRRKSVVSGKRKG